jgi:hypothetical protein
LIDPEEGLPHDLAVLDTCIKAVMEAWRVAPYRHSNRHYAGASGRRGGIGDRQALARIREGHRPERRRPS